MVVRKGYLNISGVKLYENKWVLNPLGPKEFKLFNSNNNPHPRTRNNLKFSSINGKEQQMK